MTQIIFIILSRDGLIYIYVSIYNLSIHQFLNTNIYLSIPSSFLQKAVLSGNLKSITVYIKGVKKDVETSKDAVKDTDKDKSKDTSESEKDANDGEEAADKETNGDKEASEKVFLVQQSFVPFTLFVLRNILQVLTFPLFAQFCTLSNDGPKHEEIIQVLLGLWNLWAPWWKAKIWY